MEEQVHCFVAEHEHYCVAEQEHTVPCPSRYTSVAERRTQEAQGWTIGICLLHYAVTKQAIC